MYLNFAIAGSFRFEFCCLFLFIGSNKFKQCFDNPRGWLNELKGNGCGSGPDAVGFNTEVVDSTDYAEPVFFTPKKKYICWNIIVF